MTRPRALILTAAVLAWAGPVAADESASRTVAPAPAWARSIEIVDDGAPVMLEPRTDSRRRGTIGAGTRLGFSRRVFGEGCSTDVWYETSDELFICGAHVKPSTEPPGPRVDEPLGAISRLPQRYAFVRFDGTRAYAHPSDYFQNEYVEAFGKGFGIVITAERLYGGVEFVRTRRHLWIEKGSVSLVAGSAFAGAKLERGHALDLAWAATRPVEVREKPHGKVLWTLGRHEAVHIQSTRGAWVELVGGGWVRNSGLSRARRVEPPEGVGPTDRWIDVDVDQQVLVAYEGVEPRFATLVSTGRRSKQSATPLGTFSIWVKLDYSDMDDIERTDVSKNYSIQDVPWVQFFKGSYGFHAAFWHDDFGRRRSHGCINLSPRDARYLFQFTEPVLPPGWNAILPVPEDHPTRVRIH